jgi:hypothetical protein
MAIYEYTSVFAGKPVVEWTPTDTIQDPVGSAYRLGLSYDESEAGETWEKRFASFLAQPAARQATAIVVGVWGNTSGPLGDPRHVVHALVAASKLLPQLKALFIGDIIGEEFEISWIEQTDMAPIFAAYPELEHFRVRGGTNLTIGTLNHDHLKSLIIETGGLDVSVVRDITSSRLPELEHLELWLGDDNYGANTEIVDLAPILTGRLFPKLTRLGLRDSQLSDAIAVAVSHSPLLGRLRVLDLSLGTLSDDGAAALVASPAIRQLEFLDIHHHYCSDEMVLKLAGLGIELDTSEQQTPDDDNGESYRYIAVSE